MKVRNIPLFLSDSGILNQPYAMATQRSVLVIGANGYIGSAVCRSFVRAGWRVYGLVRRAESATSLAANEIIPIVGSPADLSFIETLYSNTKTVDVIVSCIEPADYAQYYHQFIAMVNSILQQTEQRGVRPLVLWSSGCKDYGMTSVDGAPDLAPHTEESPINPNEFLKIRATYSLKVLDHADLFDGVVLRPTNVYGYSSSYYGVLFEHTAEVAASGTKTFTIGVNPKSIVHALHVDDCAEAYVALAEHANRSAVAGQVFNISSHKYETAGQVLEALTKEYQFPEGLNIVEPTDDQPGNWVVHVNLAFTQWVGSEKIRKLTGWKDVRPLFAENLHVYRLAWEASADHEDVARMKKRATGWGNEHK
jgi:nucleoside-diphosphate-sugar epimerase